MFTCGRASAHPGANCCSLSPPEPSGYETSHLGTEILLMYSSRSLIRHALVSLSFVLLYLVLSRPEIVFFSHIGLVAWYPAIGLVMALTLGVSPWYALLACFSVILSGRIIYAQPVMSFSTTVDAAGVAICVCAAPPA